MKTIQIKYYASLREQRGLSEESLQTNAQTCSDLYVELKEKYDFKLEQDSLKIAINDEFCAWDKPLTSGDVITFIPPVAGG